MQSWKLEDAEQIQKSAPYTFYRPSDAIIAQLLPGQSVVKLIFSFESNNPEAPSAERMWVLLDAVDDQGNYTGTLDNDPFHIQDLKAGDKIPFRKNHIIQFDTLDELPLKDDDAERLEQYLMRCIVSNQILRENLPMTYMYREEPQEKNDTGWHFLSGQETDEYFQGEKSTQYVSIGVIVNRDDRFLDLLDVPIGSEFELDELTGSFFPI